MNSHPMSMNLSSAIIIFSLLICPTSQFSKSFRISAHLNVSCEKPVNAVVKVFLMEEDDTNPDDDIARRLIHLTPENNKKQVLFKNVEAEDGAFDKHVEIYLAFLHNCTGIEREYCTHYKSMAKEDVHDFGHVHLGAGGGRKCPTGNWHDRPIPENPTVSVAVNASCANLTGPVNVTAIVRDADLFSSDDTVVKHHFTLSPEHRVESMNLTDVHVTRSIIEEEFDMYWVFIHTCGGTLTASCGKVDHVKFLTTTNLPPMVIDSLPTCDRPASFYDSPIPMNR